MLLRSQEKAPVCPLDAAPHSWSVHKFGGTSLACVQRYRIVSNLISQNLAAKKRMMVVVSAQGALKTSSPNFLNVKVTSLLLQCAKLAAAQDISYQEILEQIHERHRLSALELLEDIKTRDWFLTELEHDIADLRHVLRSVWLARQTDGAEWWTGYGEIWSARLLWSYMKEEYGDAVTWVDAREMLIVASSPSGSVPDMDATGRKLSDYLEGQKAKIIIITGYICSTSAGVPSTLGRDGSDYTASIFGNLVNADEVTIWTDVDGIFSADPNLVEDAIVRPEISYTEAMELAYFGAKVLHPKTMTPLLVQGIPIHIRNTFNPEKLGSFIRPSKLVSARDHAIQGFSCISGLELINIEGGGMVGVPGVAKRLFGAINDAGSSIVIITQGGSEHSVCFAIPIHQKKIAISAVENEFRTEMYQKQINPITCWGPCSCLAAVGDEMVNTVGLAGEFMSALGASGVSIRAIAQGASERNISLIVDEKDEARALNAAHAQFIRKIPIVACAVWMDPGDLGKSIVNRLVNWFECKNDCKVKLVAVSDRENMLLSKACIASNWENQFHKSNARADVDLLLQHLTNSPACANVLIDCSSSQKLPHMYAALRKAGIHVISANGCLSSFSLKDFSELVGIRNRRNQQRTMFSFSPLVDSIVPISGTVQRLQRQRVRIDRIDITRTSVTRESLLNMLTVLCLCLGIEPSIGQIPGVHHDSAEGMWKGSVNLLSSKLTVESVSKPFDNARDNFSISIEGDEAIQITCPAADESSFVSSIESELSEFCYSLLYESW